MKISGIVAISGDIDGPAMGSAADTGQETTYRARLRITHLLLLVGSLLVPLSEAATIEPAPRVPVPVEIVEVDGKFTLLRASEPYQINGAGVGEVRYLDALASAGGNSIRTWTSEGAGPILDRAHALGITVSLCLDLERERHGFDYDDVEAVAEQLARMRQEVLRYRDHPALLTWIIGNELNHDFTNIRVYDAVENIAQMIHELDPYHPTTTTIAGFGTELAREIERRAPSLDFLSFQIYQTLTVLPELIEETRFDSPFMLTEWGPGGYWEVPVTRWGAPIERNSSEKSRTAVESYRRAAEALPGQLIGSYAFLWGWKQERTSTWFSMFTEDGSETASVDAMQHLWTGRWPENRSPLVNEMRLDGQLAADDVVLTAGRTYESRLDVSDPDGDDLTFRWELKRESDATTVGGDRESKIGNLTGRLTEVDGPSVMVRAPTTPGAYRLFVYVNDGHGHAGYANIPFEVQSPGTSSDNPEGS